MLGGSSGLLLIGAVVGVGFLHTLVPDHWASSSSSWQKSSSARQTLTLRSLNALPITLTDDNAIAAAAMIGERRIPKVG